MTRTELMQDFQKSFPHANMNKTISDSGKWEFVDPGTKVMFMVWVCAFETYSDDYITGD